MQFIRLMVNCVTRRNVMDREGSSCSGECFVLLFCNKNIILNPEEESEELDGEIGERRNVRRECMGEREMHEEVTTERLHG